jgi:hypothetical protein
LAAAITAAKTSEVITIPKQSAFATTLQHPAAATAGLMYINQAATSISKPVQP